MNPNASKLGLAVGGATLTAGALGMGWRAVRGRRREPEVASVMTSRPVRIDPGASAEVAARCVASTSSEGTFAGRFSAPATMPALRRWQISHSAWPVAGQTAVSTCRLA